METLIKNGYLPVKEFSDKKKVTVQAIYQGIKTGKYESKKVGNFIFVRE